MPESKTGQVRVRPFALSSLRPSPENDRLYRRVRAEDPGIIDLARSIRENGVAQPLIVTADHFIVSGHRRYSAAALAGLLSVPAVVLDKRRDEFTDDEYLKLLREHNRQRDKSFAEQVREAVVDADPTVSLAELDAENDRRQRKMIDGQAVELDGYRGRPDISAAKRPMLDAAVRVVMGWRSTWPVSVRRVHYGLLNAPPLKHASKPGSRYRNDAASYKDLCDLLCRARLSGDVPMHAIDDETRPVDVWAVHAGVGGYCRDELDKLFGCYQRDLQQSQRRHIEIVGEKNTVGSILRPIAGQYRIPLTICRGYSSLPPRANMVERFKASGKEELVLLVASDFDPEGEDIPAAFAQSLRDDFGVSGVEAFKVALTAEQVRRFDLPAITKAKRSSSRHGKFQKINGDHAYELEALTPSSCRMRCGRRSTPSWTWRRSTPSAGPSAGTRGDCNS